MPIEITVNKDEGYFQSRWHGEVSNSEILDSYRSFLNSGEWYRGLNEFADFSDADLKQVSCTAFQQLCDLLKSHLLKHQTSMICVSYAPTDVQYGMLRLYGSICELSPEVSQVFRDKQEALAWMKTHAIKQSSKSKRV